jgi:uncharacterized membrane protein
MEFILSPLLVVTDFLFLILAILMMPVYKWFLYLKRTFPVANIMDSMDIDLSKGI